MENCLTICKNPLVVYEGCHRFYTRLSETIKYTSVTTPGGISLFNPTGNPGMAKGGSGDVLTGMIVSLLAQHYSPEQAAITGVYMHGLAADIAVEKDSVYSMAASDIIANIGYAYRYILAH